MEDIFENILNESDDDKAIAGTSQEEAAKRKLEENLKHKSNIDAKVNYYESECKRYSLQKIKLVQKCLREEPGKEFFNLDHYGVGTMQCQIMFEAFTKNPPTKLTSVSLKNNHIEHFCCHSIASYMQMSASIKELILDGCKYALNLFLPN